MRIFYIYAISYDGKCSDALLKWKLILKALFQVYLLKQESTWLINFFSGYAAVKKILILSALVV